MAGDAKAGDNNASRVYFTSATFCINGRPCIQIPILSPVALFESIELCSNMLILSRSWWSCMHKECHDLGWFLLLGVDFRSLMDIMHAWPQLAAAKFCCQLMGQHL